MSFPLRLYLGYAVRRVAYLSHLCIKAIIFTIVNLWPFIYSIGYNPLLSLLILLLKLSQTCLFTLELKLLKQLFYAQSENKLSFCGGRKLNRSCLSQQDCLCRGKVLWGPHTPEAPCCDTQDGPLPRNNVQFSRNICRRGIRRHHLGVPQTVGAAVIFQNESVSSLWPYSIKTNSHIIVFWWGLGVSQSQVAWHMSPSSLFTFQGRH